MPVDNKYTFSIIGDDKTKKAFQSIAKQTRSLVNKIGQFAAGAGVGLALITERTITAGAEMSRLAQSVGTSAQTLSEWSYAAKTVNIEGDKMADIFKDVSDKIGDMARTGGGGAADMFEQLNLDVREMVKLAPDEQLLKIGDALQSVQSHSEKVFFLEALAGDASRLLPLLEGNAEELQKLQVEARKLGVSISDVDAAKLEIAKRSMEKAQSAVEGLFTQIAVNAAPIVEVLANKFVDVAASGGGAAAAVESGFKTAGEVMGVMADGLKGIQIITKTISLVLRTWLQPLIEFGRIVSKIYSFFVDKFAAGLQKVFEFAGAAMEKMGKENPFKGITEGLSNFRGGVEELNTFLDVFTETSRSQLKKVAGELKELLTSGLPSEALAKKMDEIISNANEVAIQRAQEIRDKLNNDSGDATISDLPGASKLENERAELAARVAMIGEFNNIEFLQLQEKFIQEQTLLDEALEKQAISKSEHGRKMLALEKDFERQKKALKHREFIADANLTAGFLNDMVSVVGGSQKKIFDIQKKVSLAKALVTLPSAIIETYNNNGGYPFGIPAALAMAAKGLAQIKSIKKQSAFGGGSVSSTGGGGSASSVPTPNLNNIIPSAQQSNGGQSGPDKIVRVELVNNGNIITQDVRDYTITTVKEFIENDGILLEPGSRNGQDLIAEGGVI